MGWNNSFDCVGSTTGRHPKKLNTSFENFCSVECLKFSDKSPYLLQFSMYMLVWLFFLNVYVTFSIAIED